MVPQPLRSKAFYDLQRVGVQGRPQYPDTSIEKLQLAHRRSEIVYAAIKAKATAMIDPRLLVETRTTEDTWEEVAAHPLRRLLLRPNPEMDEAAFLGAAVTSRDTAGVFYAEIVRAAGTRLPIQLYPLDPAKVFAVPGEKNTTAAYEFRDGGKRVRIDAKDMIAWRYHDPMSKWQGLSPLAVALGSVDADNAQTDFTRDYFNNAGVPSGMLKIKGRTINETEANEIKQRWRQRFGRGWGGFHDVAVMDENAEYEKMGANLDELQSEILREFTETRVCMVFGVPPLIVYAFAGLKRATYSNLKEAWAGFWDATLTPLLKEWRTFLTWRLLPEFEGEDAVYAEQVRLNWDLSQVAALQDDVEAIYNRGEKAFRAGGITLNQYRDMLGQMPDPAGDYYLRPISYVPFLAGEQPTVTVDDVLTGKRRVLPQTVKALRDVSTATLEKRIERVLQPYLRAEYEKAVAAL
jgi:HK97 family phage portal protein